MPAAAESPTRSGAECDPIVGRIDVDAKLSGAVTRSGRFVGSGEVVVRVKVGLFRYAVRVSLSQDLTPIARPLLLADETRNEAAAPALSVQQHFHAGLIEEIKRHPALLRQLPGRVLEDLVAETLASAGFAEVSLRVRTEAGEVDILGIQRDIFGSRIAYLFELKQLGESGRPVELREVTRLYGLREALRGRLGLAQGVFMTTTSYTRPAEDAARLYGFSAQDFESLLAWINQFSSGPGGILLRNDSLPMV